MTLIGTNMIEVRIVTEDEENRRKLNSKVWEDWRRVIRAYQSYEEANTKPPEPEFSLLGLLGRMLLAITIGFFLVMAFIVVSI